MPLPLFLGVGAAIAGAVGAGTGIHGAVKMKDANDTMKAAQAKAARCNEIFESKNEDTTKKMDALGKKELEILQSFSEFSRLFEMIHNKPEFKAYTHDGVTLPKYDAEEIKEVSIGAGVLLGGIGGAALGTAGGFAAAGATTAAVMALGTASTGTAIASLSGVAATNATLAALGGGAIAAGGGGMALGTTMLGAATLGVGLMVGGVIFNIVGSSLSNKADEAWQQAVQAEEQVKKISSYLDSLKAASRKYIASITSVDTVYRRHLSMLSYIVEVLKKDDWNVFTPEEKTVTENTVLLVNLLYNMGKVKLVLPSDSKDELNTVNTDAINNSIHNANSVLASMGVQKNTKPKEEKTPLADTWSEIQERIHNSGLSDPDYFQWIYPLKITSESQGNAIITAPYEGACDIVEEKYDALIKNTIEAVTGLSVNITYVTK